MIKLNVIKSKSSYMLLCIDSTADQLNVMTEETEAN